MRVLFGLIRLKKVAHFRTHSLFPFINTMPIAILNSGEWPTCSENEIGDNHDEEMEWLIRFFGRSNLAQKQGYDSKNPLMIVFVAGDVLHDKLVQFFNPSRLRRQDRVKGFLETRKMRP